MGDVLVRVVGLGIAGLDPLGALLLASAITAGANRARVFAFTASVFVTSVLTGTALALAGNQLFDGAQSDTANPAWAYLEVGTALLIAVWLVRSIKGPGDEQAPSQRTIARSTGAIALAGAGFTLTSVLDPTFLATAAVVGPANSLSTALLSFALWTLISQVLLFALVAAFLAGAHEQTLAASRQWWQRHQSRLTRLIRVFGVLVVIALLADAGNYFATGQYLFE